MTLTADVASIRVSLYFYLLILNQSVMPIFNKKAVNVTFFRFRIRVINYIGNETVI